MSGRIRLLSGVKLLHSAVTSSKTVAPRADRWSTLPGLAGYQQSTERAATRPAAIVALGSLAAYAYYTNSTTALAEANSVVVPTLEPAATPPPVDVYLRPAVLKGLPREVILYQYEVCPFCCKVKAFLDYHKIPYRTVEVSPLSKKELKWSEHRKVPIAVLDDDILQDSSLIISRLAAEIEAGQSSQQAQQQPQASSSGSKSWMPWSKKGSKSAAQPETQVSDSSVGTTSREEEAYWRQWVDARLVKVITVNIYGTAKEAFQTFDYISATGKFNWFEAESARVAGAVMMWGISNKLKKKYGIEGNLREELYLCGDQWVEALGDRDFLGGNQPNLADLAVFGVVKSVTGTDTFMDLMHRTQIGKWYERMMAQVGDSSRVSAN
ncbi:hypothetical protein ABBQ32_009358 [Trebouxia sp. C0010 RCD-2024]